MTVKLPLYGPRVDREALNEAAIAIRPLTIHGCPDLANKLSYLAGVRSSAVSTEMVTNAIGLCTAVMGELAMHADPSRYVMSDEHNFSIDPEAISDLVESRRRARAIVGAARDELQEMVGGLLTV